MLVLSSKVVSQHVVCLHENCHAKLCVCVSVFVFKQKVVMEMFLLGFNDTTNCFACVFCQLHSNLNPWQRL